MIVVTGCGSLNENSAAYERAVCAYGENNVAYCGYDCFLPPTTTQFIAQRGAPPPLAAVAFIVEADIYVVLPHHCRQTTTNMLRYANELTEYARKGYVATIEKALCVGKVERMSDKGIALPFSMPFAIDRQTLIACANHPLVFDKQPASYFCALGFAVESVAPIVYTDQLWLTTQTEACDNVVDFIYFQLEKINAET